MFPHKRQVFEDPALSDNWKYQILEMENRATALDVLFFAVGQWGGVGEMEMQIGSAQVLLCHF